MSRPRKMSQGPPEAHDGEETVSTVAVNPTTAERRMSQELQDKLKS